MKRLIMICFVFLSFGGYIFAQEINKNVGNSARQMKLSCQSDTLAETFFHFNNSTIREKLKWDSCYSAIQIKLFCQSDTLAKAFFHFNNMTLREKLRGNSYYSLTSYMQTKNEINEKISLLLNSFNFRDSLPLSVNLKYSPWVELKRWRYCNKPLDVQEWCHERFISEPWRPITPQEEFYIYRVIAEEKLLRYYVDE